MIQFFRHIRQRLLKESRFSRPASPVGKYILYATGEIVLVVIGILIALQVNDWNAGRNERIEEAKVLLALQTDFEKTRNNVEKTIRDQTRVVNHCKELIELMHIKNSAIDFDTLGQYIYRGAFSYWRVEPVNGTYDALIGSGKTGIIQNQNLLQMLAEYAAEVKYGFEDETMAVDLTTSLLEKSSSYVSRLFPKIFHEELNWNSVLDSTEEKLTIIKQHMNNDAFLGLLIMKYGLERNRLNYQTKILEYVENIITELEVEINTKSFYR